MTETIPLFRGTEFVKLVEDVGQEVHILGNYITFEEENFYRRLLFFRGKDYLAMCTCINETYSGLVAACALAEFAAALRRSR